MNDQATLIHERNWDTLVILDACRYDYFEMLHSRYLNGTLRKVESPVDPRTGYATSDWCNKVFTGSYDDTTYISATPRVNSQVAVDGFHGGDHFNTVVDLWDHGWDEDRGTVLPEVVNDATLQKRDHTDRLIVHYIQPHFPYLGLDRPQTVKENRPERRNTLAYQMRTTVGAKVRYHLGDERTRKLLQILGIEPINHMDEIIRKHGSKALKEAYEENLIRALEAVSALVEQLSGSIIVTSDHGELLGENGYYGHSYVPRHEQITMVPWFEVAK